MFTATPRNDFLFGDDFVDGLDTPALTKEQIKAAAHIVNGGEVAVAECLRCRGSGVWRGYARTFPCNGCNGTGKATVRKNAGVKAKATKLANQQAWKEEHEAAIRYIHKRAAKSTFYGSFIDKLTAYGTLTEGQMAIVYKDMAADAAFWEKKKAEQAAAAPKVPTAAIEALFDRPEVQKLAKTPIFRTVEVTIKRAPAHGVNAGGLYVYDTDTKDYLGKVVGGKWHPKWGTKDVTAILQAVAADPTEQAIAYARKFKACCCCGKTLRAPVSVLAVVGPVCGPRWGLDHLRMEAAALLDAEKAEEEILATRAGGQ